MRSQFETYTRYSRVVDEKQKKKVLGVFNSIFETYTRYSGVADEEQKKVLGIFNDSFLRNLVKWNHNFFKFFKGGLLINFRENLV